MGVGDVTVNLNNPLAKRCASFDGVDDYVSVADTDDLSFGDGSNDSPFSISAWVNMDDVTNFMILAKGIFNNNAEYRLIIDGDDKIQFLLFDESVISCYIGRMYNTAITSYEGQWIHLVGTYDGSGTSAGIKIYLNGTQIDNTNDESNAGSYIAMENLGANVEIGKYSTSYADGKIGTTKTWNKELTQAETTKLYEGLNVTDELIHKWNLDSDYKDSVGNNDGTNEGSRLTTQDDQVANAISTARTTANDKIIAYPLNNKIMSVVIEEAP